jgi:squalene-hopene/tetraprenyl-beta-curcumene cyclase
MTARDFLRWWLALAFIVLAVPSLSFAGDATPADWNRAGAAQYLDGRGKSWFNFSGANRGEGATASHCVSCHSLLPYALARPVLRRMSKEKVAAEWETKMLAQTKSRVANWDQLDEIEYQLFYDFDDAKKVQSRGTEAVLNAFVLSLAERDGELRQASAEAKKALSILWATQIKEGPDKGAWEWLNFGLEPWEASGGQYLGATIAAIAVGAGVDREGAEKKADAQSRVQSLRDYLASHYEAQNLHNRAWLLWASSAGLDGLLSGVRKDQLIEQLLAKQQPGGGFSLGSLGDFTHGEIKTPNPNADGYATGLVLHALQLAGVPKEHPAIRKGLDWLRANQDASGAWRATSVNKRREPESKNASLANIGKFMWDAATGYAVLALGD